VLEFYYTLPVVEVDWVWEEENWKGGYVSERQVGRFPVTT
jgi:hypothetical protein